MRKNFLDLGRLCERMKAEGMAAVVASSPNAVFHTSGCLIITHNPIRDRLAFCVTTAEGRQTLVVCNIEVSLCEHDSWVRDIRGYVEFKELPTHLLARTLSELSLTGKRVGIDLEYLRDAYFRELSTAAPDVDFMPADALLGELRETKPPGLIAEMGAAARTVEAAIDTLFDDPLAGLTERHIRARLRKALAERGADGSYLIVASGPNVAVPEHRATDRVLANGEALLLDAAITCDGYVGEAARTRVPGREQATGRTKLETVWEAAATALVSGALGRDVYARAEASASAAGGTLRGGSVGFGVSFGGKEPPFLTPQSDHVLKPGMTIALDVDFEDETGIRLRDKSVWLVSDGGSTELARTA